MTGASESLGRRSIPKLPGSQINISEHKEPQMGQSRGKLRGQDMQGMCGCRCSVSLLRAGRSISLSLQYGARGQVGLHATISSPNTLFLKSCSPKLVHLSSWTYSSFCPAASSCLITCSWLQENPPAPLCLLSFWSCFPPQRCRMP